MSYHEIMAEPMPSSEDFGFEPPENWREDTDALIAAADAFEHTEGYWLWQIAVCEWMIRRTQAELDRHADGKSGYAEWVRRNNPSTIAYEKRLIAKYEGKLKEVAA